jgi:twitching motility protein PilT
MENLQYEQKMKHLLLLVGQQSASDLHLVVGRYPTFRIDGRLVSLSEEDLLSQSDLVGLSNILLTEQIKEEFLRDGQVDFSYDFEGKARFRTSVFLQKGFISVSMRFVSQYIRTLEELSLPQELTQFTKYAQGLVLITGPVGHGKSTTLAALIDDINHTQEKHIITIEDPIEYVYLQDHCIINQREVGRDTKSFSQALSAVFREDVNIVLLGELRDLDTISTAMTAAETGHLIFATVHTNDCAQTIDRIVDVFPVGQQNQIRIQLANVLVGVISQRLIPKIGGGRVPAVEIMIKNQAVENLIRDNKSYQINSVIETGLKDGMVSLDRALVNLVQQELITIQDAFHYTKNTDYAKILLEQQR